MRAEQRRQWQAARTASSAQREAAVAVSESDRAAADRTDRQLLRHELIHQPLPMPAFDTVFVPEKSRHALTAPTSPRLHTKMRASVGAQLTRKQPGAQQKDPRSQRCSSRW